MRGESNPENLSFEEIAHPARSEDIARWIIQWQGNDLHIRHNEFSVYFRYCEEKHEYPPELQWLESSVDRTGDLWSAILAALESAFNKYAHPKIISLVAPAPLRQKLVEHGVAVIDDSRLLVFEELFWQRPDLWLRHTPSSYLPLQFIMKEGRRFPRRPNKPIGQLYCRYIPWLNQTLSFHAFDIERDLEYFHRWMNDSHVALFWQEEGDIERHREYIRAQLNDPHCLPVIGRFGNQPFGYFELYWAKEDRIAPFYEVDNFDRGWHVLVGDAAFRGRPWFTAWFPSLMHYLFLDDCRTQRIVAEPRVDNERLLRNSAKTGFSQIKEFDFPHKRAMLLQLWRERFFGEGLLFPHAD